MDTKQTTARIIAHPATVETISRSHRTIFVKPYSVKELTALYGVSLKTFRKWIEPFKDELGDKHGAFFTIRQVKIIFDKLDVPHYYEVA